MELSDRSKRSKEAQAEYLLKVSSSLMIAFLVTILILPMTVIIEAILGGGMTVETFKIQFTSPLYLIGTFVFVGCEVAAVGAAKNFKDRAMDILDALENESESIENETS